MASEGQFAPFATQSSAAEKRISDLHSGFPERTPIHVLIDALRALGLEKWQYGGHRSAWRRRGRGTAGDDRVDVAGRACVEKRRCDDAGCLRGKRLDLLLDAPRRSLTGFSRDESCTDLPVEEPTQFSLGVNLCDSKSARRHDPANASRARRPRGRIEMLCRALANDRVGGFFLLLK
jgi:hypothetical protein